MSFSVEFIYPCFIFWQLEHGKKYDSEVEESFRMKIFTENKHKIAKHNKGFAMGHHTYKLEMNKYGDMVSVVYGRGLYCLVYIYTVK